MGFNSSNCHFKLTAWADAVVDFVLTWKHADDAFFLQAVVAVRIQLHKARSIGVCITHRDAHTRTHAHTTHIYIYDIYVRVALKLCNHMHDEAIVQMLTKGACVHQLVSCNLDLTMQ